MIIPGAMTYNRARRPLRPTARTPSPPAFAWDLRGLFPAVVGRVRQTSPSPAVFTNRPRLQSNEPIVNDPPPHLSHALYARADLAPFGGASFCVYVWYVKSGCRGRARTSKHPVSETGVLPIELLGNLVQGPGIEPGSPRSKRSGLPLPPSLSLASSDFFITSA